MHKKEDDNDKNGKIKTDPTGIEEKKDSKTNEHA